MQIRAIAHYDSDSKRFDRACSFTAASARLIKCPAAAEAVARRLGVHHSGIDPCQAPAYLLDWWL
jgi:hypothetical protein